MLLLIAFLLRLYRLRTDSLWIDEAATLGIARLDWWTLFHEMAAVESNPPGFYLLAKLWLSVFGFDVVALRLLSAVAGTLALVPFWLFCRRTFGARAAWLAAVMFALAASEVRMSQDGRCYAVLMLVFCCALLAAWRLLTAATRPDARIAACLGPALLLGALQGAMVWLHPTACIAVLGLDVAVTAGALLRADGRWRTMLLLSVANFVALLLAVPPLWFILVHLGESSFTDRWIPPPGVLESLRIYGRTLVAPLLWRLSPLAGLLFAGALAAGLVRALRTRNTAFLALFALLMACGLAFPLLSQHWPVMLDRTVLFLLAPLLALVAAGLCTLRPPIFGLAAACAILLQALGLIGWHTLPVRQEQWREAAAILQRDRLLSEPVILPEGAFAQIALETYLPVPGRIMVVPPVSPIEILSAERLSADLVIEPDLLCDALVPAQSAWVVTRTPPPLVGQEPAFSQRRNVEAELRGAGGTVTRSYDLVGIRMDHWQVPHCSPTPRP